MLHRAKDHNTIGFLNISEEKNIEDIVNKKISEDEKLMITAEEQKSKKLNSYDNGYKTTKSIMSARAGEISDFGGRVLKGENTSSIWKEQQENKKEEEDFKFEISKESIQKIQEDNKKKADNTYITGTQTAIVFPKENKNKSNYKSPINNISMFDSKEFSKLQNKTAGEQLSDELKEKENKKDESWKNNGKAFYSKDAVSRLFDNLSEQK